MNISHLTNLQELYISDDLCKINNEQISNLTNLVFLDAPDNENITKINHLIKLKNTTCI